MTAAADHRVMPGIYRRLSLVGFTRPFINRHLLPDWWDEDLAKSSGGLLETAAMLSRGTGLPIDYILGDRSGYELPEARFKRAKEAQPSEFETAVLFGSALARSIAAACEAPYAPLPRDASALRASILESGAPWVDLQRLVDTCWKSGVPVVHLPKARLPTRAQRKMEGMALFTPEGRPVIVLTSARRDPFLLFDLAHEVGHVALGHVTPDSPLLVDEQIPGGADTDLEADELDANRYAIGVLAGGKAFKSERLLRGDLLAAEAARVGREFQVDPGHLVLNYAETQRRAGV
ncbi:MAG: hypothetical protein AAFX94_09455, partial [Myxococcota bacterium]